MVIGSLGWGEAEATGDGGGEEGGVAGFAGMTIVGSGSRAFVVVVVGAVAGEPGGEPGAEPKGKPGDDPGDASGVGRVSSRGPGLSGPAAIT
jgi:hypothetical protein